MVVARDPDGPPHATGDSGLHADAVRHVLQHLDLPRCDRGLCPRLLHLISSAGSEMMVWTVRTRMDDFLKHFYHVHSTEIENHWNDSFVQVVLLAVCRTS